MEEEKTENFQVVVENREIEQIGQSHVEYVIPENFSLDGDETFIIETDNPSVSLFFNIPFFILKLCNK